MLARRFVDVIDALGGLAHWAGREVRGEPQDKGRVSRLLLSDCLHIQVSRDTEGVGEIFCLALDGLASMATLRPWQSFPACVPRPTSGPSFRYLSSVRIRPCLDGAPLASQVWLLCCGVGMRPCLRPVDAAFPVPLAMMPSPPIRRSQPIARAWQRRVVNGFAPDHRSRHWAACVSQSPALANLLICSPRQAAAGSR